LICYLNYLEKNKSLKYILLTGLFFILALFSKSMAVSLPIVLLLIDWYKKRKYSIRLLTEKVPFLLLSIVFGIIVINSQQSSGFLEDTLLSFTISERVLLSSYAAVIYIFKVFVPFNTLFMTDYPDKLGGHLPMYIYLAPLFIGLIGVLIYKARIFRRELVFGLFFYLITISLVLQIIPVSGFLWDHYTYVPSVGILFIAGQFYGYVQDKRFSYAHKLKGPLNFILLLFVLLLIVVTWNRNVVWKNSESLFTEVIRLNPDNEAAYVNRGLFLLEQGDYKQAENDFSQAIKVRDNLSIAWLNRGLVRFEQKKYEEAMKDMDQAIKLVPSENAYLVRGKLKADIGYHQKAIEDFNQAFEMNNNSSKALNNIGLSLAKLEKYNEALEYFNKSIEINPGSAFAYGNRGALYYQTGNKQKACADWQRSAELGNKRANQILLKYCK
jgi:tetratricopeptide (TPR) repeat protein